MNIQRNKYPNFTDLLVAVGIFVAALFVAAATMLILNIFNIEKELVTAIVYPIQFLPVIIFLHYYRKSRMASQGSYSPPNAGYEYDGSSGSIVNEGEGQATGTPESAMQEGVQQQATSHSESTTHHGSSNHGSSNHGSSNHDDVHAETLKKASGLQSAPWKIRLAPRAMNLPLTLWGIVLILAVSVLVEPLLGLFPDKYFDMIDTAIGRGPWTLLTTVIMAPILEEWLFRGQILGPVKDKYGPTAALLVSALLFGLIHGIPPQVVNAFFIGLILGYVYLKTGSLLSVIVMHTVNNALAYLQMELSGNPSATLRESVGSDALYFIIYGACIVLFAIGIVGMVRTVKNLKI